MNFLFVLFSLLLITGCQQQEQPRQYTEVVTPSPEYQVAPDSEQKYSWVLPAAWKQGPDKVMRLASFYLANAPNAIDCSIDTLPGTAGGSEANLKRWMGQIGIDPSDDNYHKLDSTALTIQTQGGLEARFYDLTSLQQRPSDKSMIAAIISTNDATLFVKMTGTSEDVRKNQDNFLELLKSLAAK